jgi:hypothetical protein
MRAADCFFSCIFCQVFHNSFMLIILYDDVVVVRIHIAIIDLLRKYLCAELKQRPLKPSANVDIPRNVYLMAYVRVAKHIALIKSQAHTTCSIREAQNKGEYHFKEAGKKGWLSRAQMK